MASAGVEFDFVVSSAMPASGAAGIAAFISDLKSFAAAHPGSLISVEGLNEANLHSFSYNGSSSMAAAAEFQKALYTAINADPMLTDVAVLNLTIGNDSTTDYAALGDLSAYADYANAHTYTKTGTAVDGTMEKQLALAQSASKSDPIVITETGYTTLASFNTLGVSETAQATLVLRNLLDAFENGSAKTYLYELFDNDRIENDGVSTSGGKESEEHFGLFRADGSAKPAATAIHNLTTILSYGDDGTGVAAPHDYTLSGMPTASHAMVLDKSGGVYDIVLWSEATVWNDSADVDIVNAAKTVTVTLDKVESVVRIYDPLGGTTPSAVYYNVKSFDVALGDHPLIIDIGASSPVIDTVGTLEPDLSMTAAEFVSAIDGMVGKTGLEQVTLTDSHVLEVSSVATMKYMIANYGDVLSKIAGDYTFSVKLEQATWRQVMTYDEKGAFVQETDYSLSGGVVVSKFVKNADGSTDAYSYGLKNLSYTEQHQSFDASGKLVALVRSHADGSLAYTETRTADGTTVFTNYDALGVKTSMGTTNANGSTSFDSYNIKGKSYVTQHQDIDASGKTIQVVRKHADGSLDYTEATKAGVKTSDYYDAKGVLTSHSVVSGGDQSTTIYTNGVKTALYITDADGSKETYAYGLKGLSYTQQYQSFDQSGQLISLVRSHADGSLDSTQTRAADGSVTYAAYDSTGHKLNTVVVEADGDRITDTYDAASGLLTRHYEQNADGSTDTTSYTKSVKTAEAVTHKDGTSEFSSFNIKGQTYVTQVQTLDASGKVVSVVRSHADGSLDYTEITDPDGSKTVSTYNSSGVLTSTVETEKTGERDVFVFSSDGSTRHEFYNATKAIVSIDVLATNGSHSVTGYATGLKLVGGVGDDAYFLLGDKETVAFKGGHDTVKSFSFQSSLADHIEISRSIAHSFADLTVKQTGADVLVTFAGHDDSLLLTSVKAAQVTSDYFLFA